MRKSYRQPFKKGIYKPVHRNKYAGIHLPEYRSSWELKFFQWCDKNTNVLEWTSESVVSTRAEVTTISSTSCEIIPFEWKAIKTIIAFKNFFIFPP